MVRPSCSADRIDWIDTAKAACIVLVVLYHARHATYLVGWPTTSAPEVWGLIGAALRPVRMPLFFLASGLAGAHLLNLTWAGVGRRRLWDLARVYLLWAIVYAAVMPGFPGSGLGLQEPDLRPVLLGQSDVWYLWALVIFIALARLTRGLPARVIVGGAALLAIGSAFMPAVTDELATTLRCMVFFIIGARCPEVVARLSSYATGTRLAIAGLAACLLVLISWSLGTSTNLIVDAISVLVGVWMCVLTVRRFPWVVRWARPVSRRTLQIYVLHFPLLLTGIELLRLLPDDFWAASILAAAAPALLTGAAVGVSAVLGMACDRLRLTQWLFISRSVPPDAALHTADSKPPARGSDATRPEAAAI